MKKCVIARHVNGITLNGYEFVLDENGEKMVFENRKEAMAMLGANEENLVGIFFFDYEKLLEGEYEEVESVEA